MAIENGDLVKHKIGDLILFVVDASGPKLIKCRKSYEDDRPDEIFFIDPDNLIIKEKHSIVRL